MVFITNTEILMPEEIKKDFPIFTQSDQGKELIFLDSAASSQRPSLVIDAMSNYYQRHHANVHRSVYTLAEQATALYEGSRKKIASYIKAKSSKEILFGKNVTEQINLVANSWGRKNLKKGDVIVLTEMEHHANFVPWLMLANEIGLQIRYLYVDEDGKLDISDLDNVLKDAKLLAFTAVSNVLGTINPVKHLTTAARNAGAVTVVDFAQWAPHMSIDAYESGADFIGFTGHKMLGPTGIGVLWGRQELLEKMPPFLGGGDMILDVTLDGYTTNELPWKFEAGTPPIAEAIGLAAAIEYLEKIGLDKVIEHEKYITNYALNTLNDQLGQNIKIYGPNNAEEKASVISFDLIGVHPHDIGQFLNDKNIAIRAGHHCAKPLHAKFGIAATARASFYIYNDISDVDALVNALLATRKFFL